LGGSPIKAARELGSERRETVWNRAVYKSGYMLGSLVRILRYSCHNLGMSDNASGAGDQQGRPDERLGYYIAGFVDGEGSFHVAIQRNPTTMLGWQIIPELHISQHECNKHVLELIRRALGCGYLKPNARNDPRDKTWVLVVRSRKDLLEKVIPFFERYPLRTTKRQDFEKFACIVRKMAANEHRTPEGFRALLKIAASMNDGGAYRRIDIASIHAHLEPSETVRQTPSK